MRRLDNIQESTTLFERPKSGHLEAMLANMGPFSFFWLVFALEDFRNLELLSSLTDRHCNRRIWGNWKWLKFRIVLCCFPPYFPFHELKCFWESLRWLIQSEEKLRNTSNRWWLKTRPSYSLQLFSMFCIVLQMCFRFFLVAKQIFLKFSCLKERPAIYFFLSLNVMELQFLEGRWQICLW